MEEKGEAHDPLVMFFAIAYVFHSNGMGEFALLDVFSFLWWVDIVLLILPQFPASISLKFFTFFHSCNFYLRCII